MSSLIEIQNVSRVFQSGDETITALSGIDLSIESGELVAIVGVSGSGKSTLMNILGCLDQPSSGEYRVDGRSVAGLTADELASLRREHFGFIFQRYQLLATLDAVENVAMPAVYAGTNPAFRQQLAKSLLEKLGLGDRFHHRPNQLSGGQQQRVSIARALMNGGRIILADEPTGALDSKSGETVLSILKDLHGAGHTVIIVTHDMEVAGHADRIIEIRDGLILSDRRIREVRAKPPTLSFGSKPIRALAGFRRRLVEALSMALRSMAAHRVRTVLTMLGIVIGISAVVAVVGLGEGTRQKVLAQISDLGASTLSVYPGRHWGDERAASVRTLVISDAEALAAQPYVDSVTPQVSSSARIRSGGISVTANVSGVGQDHFRVNGMTLMRGTQFSAESIAQRGQEAVIDDRAAATLFPDGRSPLHKIIMVDQVPIIVIGVVARPSSFGADRTLQIYLPYTSVTGRLLGAATSFAGLTVRIADEVDTATAERAIVGLMTRRHGAKDFFVFNSDQLRRTMETASQTMALLISSVALISLIVGGIGVMNIMLVSVTERTREIGLRMAVGARQIDIMLQFLIEAIAICIAGSLIGVGLALGIAQTLGGKNSAFPMIISVDAILAACLVAVLIGLVFGFLPARNASRLDPIEALSRE